MKVEERWRWIVAADIVFHLTAVWWFAYLPPNTLNRYETLIMLLATLAGVGVLTHASTLVNLPYDHWAYLGAGFVCLFTFIAYEIRTFGEIPYSLTIPFGLFLLAGTVSAFAAHIVDGGADRRGDRGR